MGGFWEDMYSTILVLYISSMYRFLMVPSRVVMLDLEANDSCEEKSKSCGERAVKLRLE